MFKNHRIVSIRDYNKFDDFIKNQYYETVFLDEFILNHAIIFYNQYFGYVNHPIDREEALIYASLGTRINSEFFRLMGPSDEKSLDMFYQITPFHFFNNIIRFMDGMHLETLRTFVENEKSPILDIGGGIGGFSIGLAKSGFDVTYVESNILCLGWMKYISKILDLKIEILSSKDKIEKKFKLIIAKDIIEHVVDPVAFYDYIFSLRDEGGKIYLSQYPCCGPDEMAPMHFKVDGEIKDGNHVIRGSKENNLKYLAKYDESKKEVHSI